ncbi:MAG TPA: methyltransferase domain-containing protein [Dehalococcoidia bacterium]|nr:methyltransferase domain-containing protein [Dehalococcoidia bacterium]
MHHKREAAPITETPPHTAGKVIRWARFYDAASWLMSFGRAGAIRRMTLEMAAVSPGEAVLDVGCGTGTLAIAAKEAAGAGGEVCGIDASPEMIEVARGKTRKAGTEVRFDVGLIESIPYPDGRFDLVLSSLMLHHLPDDLKRAGFAEIHRVLKPGGRADARPSGRFLAVDLSGQSDSFIGHLLSLFGHAHHGGMSALPALLQDAGFTDVATGPTVFGPLAYLRGRKAEG